MDSYGPNSPEFVRLLVGASISNMGFAFLWPLVALYIHSELHQSMTVVGIVMMGQAGAGVVGSLIGGVLYDARGARMPLLWTAGSSTVILALLAWDRNFWIFTVGLSLINFSLSSTMPIFNALAVAIWPTGGRSSFNAVYVAMNAGVAVGSSLGGLLASINFPVALLSAALVMGVLWVIVMRTYNGDVWTTTAITPIVPYGAIAKRGWVGWVPMFLALALSLQWIAYDQWEVTVPNFMQFEKFPLPMYSLLWTLNTLLILVAQPVLRQVISRTSQVTTQLLIGSGLFLIGFGLLTWSHTYFTYVSAMVITTLGEMLVLPGVPAVAEARARPERRGLVQGVVSTGAALGRMVGPLVGGFVYTPADPGRLFSLMVGIVILGSIGYVVSDRLWTKERLHEDGKRTLVE